MNPKLNINEIHNRFEQSVSKLEKMVQPNEIQSMNLTKIYHAAMIAYNLYDILYNNEISMQHSNDYRLVQLSKLNQIAEKIIQYASLFDDDLDTYPLQCKLIIQRKFFFDNVITIDENCSRDDIRKLLFN